MTNNGESSQGDPTVGPQSTDDNIELDVPPPTLVDDVPQPAKLLSNATQTELPPIQRTTLNDCLRVAVLGDVGTDWAFISSQPARSRSPAFQPWTKYPATHIFSFPGGAWFSGHMIQGALSDPIFRQRDVASTTSNESKDFSTAKHIVLTADMPPFKKGSPDTLQSLSFKIPLSQDDIFSQHYAVIIGDDKELDLPSYLTESSSTDELLISLTFARPDDPEHSKGRMQLGLLDSTISFDTDPNTIPGRMVPDKVFRRYEAEAFSVPIPDKDHPRELTFFTFEKLDFQLSIENTLLGTKDGKPTYFNSLRIVPSSLRHGDFGHIPPLKVFTSSNPATLKCMTGNMDVTYGALELSTTTTDKGKFNPPHSSIHVTDASHPLTVFLTAHDCSRVPEHTIPHILWFYENPRSLLAMQHPGHVVHTLSELAIYKRHPTQKGTTRVYRRKLIHGIDGPRHGYPTILNKYRTDKFNWTNVPRNHSDAISAEEWKSAGHRIVVIDDEGTGFSSRHQLWSPFLWDAGNVELRGRERDFYDVFCSKLDATPADDPSSVDTYLQSTFVVIKASHWINPPRSHLVDFITRHDVRYRSLLVISAESLRGGLVDEGETTPGIKLAKAVSWEQTLEDFEVALSDERLRPLRRFAHIIIRLGLDGAIIWSSGASTGQVDHTRLVFDPSRIEGEYSESSDLGQFPGLTTVFTAAIVRRLASALVSQKDKKDTSAATRECGKILPDSVKYALQCCRRYFDLGYGPEPDTVRKFENLQLPISQVFGQDVIDACRSKGRHSFALFPKATELTQPEELRRRSDEPADGKSRSILFAYLSAHKPGLEYRDENLMDKAKDMPALVRAINAINLGRKIVRQGPERAFKQASFPYARFNKLLTTDRAEIEGLRSIRNVLSEYVHHDELKIPLSVAVFGPPGSGKSFGVQQIAEGLAPDRIQKFVFNLAQFRSFKEISRLLLEVRDAGIEDKLPLVFFDEFDTPLENQPLGWLKLFLAPMQDGRFQHDDSTLGIGKAIFVFAGGIAATHSNFMDHQFWNGRYGDKNLFRTAKGTDFHSRLRGFLDISGTNAKFVSARDAGDTNAITRRAKEDQYRTEDFAYVIRRALLVRQIIERLSEESKAKLLDEDKHAEIDGDVLDALLLTEEYRHGVRSIEAVFQMSSLHGERVISKTALPSSPQLAMHVDDSFLNILTRKHTQLGSRVLEGALDSRTADRQTIGGLSSRHERVYYNGPENVMSD